MRLNGLTSIVVVLVNVVSVRRYTRWDWTSNQRYSLSPATVDTLRQKASEEKEILYVRLKAAEALGTIKP